MSRTRNYLKGLTTGYAATLATILVGLWLTPFTLRFLDREEYGLFALASDLLMWLGLLDLGITAGLNVQAAQLTGRPDAERLNRLASTAFFTQNVIVLMVLAVGSALALGIPHFFPVRPDLHRTTSVLMGMLVLGSAIGFSTKTFSALLVAHQQLHIDNLLKLALLAIRTVLTVLLLKEGWGLYSLAFASLAATLITSAIAVWRTWRLLPGLQIRWVLASWDVLKGLGNLGIWFSLGGIAGILITSFDRVVAAKMISVETVTTLSLTGRVYALFGGLLDQITNTARPMLGQLLGQNKIAEAQRVYRHLFTLSTGFAVIAAFSLWAGNEPFVTRWVGGQNFGGPLLSLALALNLIVHSWVLPNRAVLSAALVVRPQALSRTVEAGLNLGLSVLLGYYLGLIGIVLGTAVAGLLTSTWYLPLLTARLFNRSWFTFVRQDALPILAVGTCLLPIVFLAQIAGKQIGGFLGAGVGAGLTAIAGFGLLWLIAFDNGLRNLVVATVTKVSRTCYRSVSVASSPS
ncbi:MAG: lipopolysaccharide biosynthesis protein [Verrucomicrobia bacterium]|nr:lipopolysaccharide biosynthesis protein [Verrucomicrobiota bacterium]